MVGYFLISFLHGILDLETWDADSRNQSRWHVFTAIGGYIAVEVVDMIASGEVHEDPTDQFAWPIADVARFIGGAPGTKKLN
jgi:hypothetical protein